MILVPDFRAMPGPMQSKIDPDGRRAHGRSAVSMLLCALVFGCGVDRDDPAPWSEEEFLPPGGHFIEELSRFDTEFSAKDRVADADAFDGWVSRLRDGVPVWTFGEEDSAETGQVIGALTDLTVMGQEIVLLDGRTGRLSFVDAESGTIRKMYGRPGPGPDEFQNAVSVAAASPPAGRRLLVVDDFFRLRVLEVTGDSVAMAFTVRQESFLHGACFTRDRLVLHLSPQPDANVVTYRADPAPGLEHLVNLRSPEQRIRPLYHHPHPSASRILDQSAVACGGSTVALGNALLPLMRVAYPDDRVDWRIRFSGFVFPKVQIRENHSVNFSSVDAQREVTLDNLHYLSESLLLVQFRRREGASSSAEGRSQVEWESFILDTERKIGAYVGRLEGKVLAYVPDFDRLIWGRDAPFPQLTATMTPSATAFETR